MKDLISRQAAIDACIRVREHRAYDEIEEIKALPSAEPNIKTLTPKEFVGEISPVSLYSANEWHSVTVWLYEMGYVICRRENR